MVIILVLLELIERFLPDKHGISAKLFGDTNFDEFCRRRKFFRIHQFLLLLEHFSSNLVTNFTKCTPPREPPKLVWGCAPSPPQHPPWIHAFYSSTGPSPIANPVCKAGTSFQIIASISTQYPNSGTNKIFSILWRPSTHCLLNFRSYLNWRCSIGLLIFGYVIM
jgi:hypothetical protein